jgi:ceramide glucosyltransferase|uniref:Ceramide glucosyltransferase n=1 Tax=Leptospirillum sp. Group II '5-way CG' TaxID=419541 RepID=B6AQN7_9BACT|nr:MAG: Ceramide glucosyltransferase [Leptospirillum sp. Group II '5-way CG']
MTPLNIFPGSLLPRLPVLMASLLVGAGGIGVFFDFLAYLGGRKLFSRKNTPEDRLSWPSILMIKPVKGLDEGARENFLSFLQQDYPEYQILFVVGDGSDPVVELLRELQAEYPEKVRFKIIFEHSGTNRKMNNVNRAFEGENGELILLNDSDIRVDPRYLKSIVRPMLDDPSVGMVTCLQRGTPAGGWSSRLASLMLNSEAIPQALVAYRLFPIDFAFGPTMLLRRDALEKSGGFSALTDILADDYHLAQNLVREGYKIHLSSYLVDARIGEESAGDLWQHEIRWVRTYRNCRPVGYAFSILTRPFVFLLTGGLLAAATGQIALAGGSLFLYLLHFLILITLSDQMLDRPLDGKDLCLFPVREALSLLLYLGSFGSRIVWRGHAYRLMPDGTLRAMDSSSFAAGPASGREAP